VHFLGSIASLFELITNFVSFIGHIVNFEDWEFYCVRDKPSITVSGSSISIPL
jgi:hypothetical protein